MDAPRLTVCFPEQMETLAAVQMPAWAVCGGWDVVDGMTAQDRPSWCMAEVDIFQDLSEAEMDAMSRAAPMRTYAAGELLHTPLQQVEALFILKQGRVRVFRLSADGRALTTAILSPGTIFGEMVVVGQQMYDSYAEALEDVVVCVMDRADVHRFLLGDARIAARIAETLGRRLAQIESQWSDAVFKSVPERVAGALLRSASTTLPTNASASSSLPNSAASTCGNHAEPSVGGGPGSGWGSAPSGRSTNGLRSEAQHAQTPTGSSTS